MVESNFLWIPFLIFAFVNSFTPGPNVVMLTSSGSVWGYKKTFPHLLGVCIGFPLMLLVVQFGADEIFKNFPWLFPLLTFLSLLYVLWLSYKIFISGFKTETNLTASLRPMTFTEGLMFQWVNGKAWQIVIMVATLYPTQDMRIKLLGALCFLAILFISASMWVEVGKRISRFLNKPNIRISYYSLMALSLIASTFPTGVAQLLAYFKI